MKVQTELSLKDLVRVLETIPMTALLQKRKIYLFSISTEYMPSHFNIAVGGYVNRGRRRGLLQRKTERPPTENVPLIYSGLGFQPNQLIFSL